MRGRLLRLLDERAAAGRPLRFALVGAGKFGTMLLAQAAGIDGLEVACVCDRDPARAETALATAGLGGVPVTADAHEAVAHPGADVVVEATGSPLAGAEHALAAIEAGRSVVMATVEADVLAGPALAARAEAAGVAYSLAYGDQPALVCELVDWARLAGFEVVCAGKGTKHLPAYHASTPDTVWDHYGLTREQAAAGGLDARMFNSFLDGTKSAIEAAAIANATALPPQPGGLGFPPCGSGRLAEVCIPREDGGALATRGTVEVVSSLERDGTPVEDDLRWGVFVTFAARTPYAARCLAEYGVRTDRSGAYAALYRPSHLVGLEASVSVLAAGLLGEATGCPAELLADVAATAKRDLAPGEVLDGEGGATVYGSLRPIGDSIAASLLPIGLAAGLRLVRPVAAGRLLQLADVEPLPASTALALRSEALGPLADAPAR
jgi:predicted homoserine dehydrogenase-like protein